MAEHRSDPLHDGETQAKAEAALAGGIVDLVEFFEDRLEMLDRDAHAGVPDFEPEPVAAPAAAEKDLAARRVFHGIPQEIADHLLQQPRIAPHTEAALDHAPVELLCCRVIGEFGLEPLEQSIDRKDDDLGIDDPGFQLVDVEQCVQHARHDLERLVELADQRQGAFFLDRLRQYSAQKAQSLQRLAQIVTGGGQEARLSEIGLLRRAALPTSSTSLTRLRSVMSSIVTRIFRPRGRSDDLASRQEQRPPARQRRHVELDFIILDVSFPGPDAIRGIGAVPDR